MNFTQFSEVKISNKTLNEFSYYLDKFTNLKDLTLKNVRLSAFKYENFLNLKKLKIKGEKQANFNEEFLDFLKGKLGPQEFPGADLLKRFMSLFMSIVSNSNHWIELLSADPTAGQR